MIVFYICVVKLAVVEEYKPLRVPQATSKTRGYRRPSFDVATSAHRCFLSYLQVSIHVELTASISLMSFKGVHGHRLTISLAMCLNLRAFTESLTDSFRRHQASLEVPRLSQHSLQKAAQPRDYPSAQLCPYSCTVAYAHRSCVFETCTRDERDATFVALSQH